MELHELRQAWQYKNKDLDKTLELNERLLKEASLGQVKSQLGELRFSSWVEIVVDGLFIFLFGGSLLHFLWEHISELKFAAPALLLFFVIVGGLVFNISLLISVHRLQPRLPILHLQKRLEEIRLWQKREAQSLYAVIPLMYGALIVVGMKGLLGLDAYEVLGQWLWWQVGGSVVIALGVVWFVQLFPDKGVARAIAFLKEIREFEEE